MKIIREARDGGSITPEYKRILGELVKEGRVAVKEGCEVVGAEWDEERRYWRVETEPEVEMVGVNYMVYATGVEADIQKVDAVKPLLKEYPIEIVGGMPCLTNELMWNDEVPFFVTGRLAELRVGPAAGNLEGARQGAERMVWKVGEVLREVRGESDSGYGSEGVREWMGGLWV